MTGRFAPDRWESTLARALAGDEGATESLVEAFTPVVQARIARVLLRASASMRRDVRQEVEDMTQDALCALFAQSCRVLREWDPARGLSLLNFVGLVAEREAMHILRSRRRSPWTDVPAPGEDLERSAGSTEGPEGALASRQAAELLWRRVKETLTPRGVELFLLLFVEERPVDEVCARANIQRDALYAWKSRFLKTVRSLAEEAPAAPTGARTSAPREEVP